MAKTCTIIKDGRADAYGRPLLVGQTYTGPDDEVFSLWQSGFASVAGAPGAFLPATQIKQQIIAQSNIPLFIMPGDGSANGCQFTGTNGDFTLSAAILSGIGAHFAGAYSYFPANFGGSSRPAGFYWVEFSSDTAGKVYANTYNQVGPPQRPISNAVFSESLTGWNTAPTTEITAVNEILVPGGSLGLNGRMLVNLHHTGSSAGSKTVRIRDSDMTTWVSTSTSTNSIFDNSFEIICLASHTMKKRHFYFGSLSPTINPAPFTGVSTLGDQLLSLTIQQSVNTACIGIDSFQIIATYGA